MGQIKNSIDAYELSIELANYDDGELSKLFAQITLFSNGHNVAELNFVKEGFDIGKKYLSGAQLNVEMPADKYAATVDLLRNEKPIRLIVWYEGPSLDNPGEIEARLATAELEPVGEGE